MTTHFLLPSWRQGFRAAWASKRLITLVYAFNLLLALVLAVPFFSVLEAGAHNSLAPGSLLAGFDYTVFKDFMHGHGDAVQALLSQAKWMAFAYLLFSVLLSGGILHTLAQPRAFSMATFFEGCGRYFFRFLRLLFFVVLLQVIVAAVVYIPLAIFFSQNKSVEVESSLFYIGLSGFLLHLFLFGAVLLIGDYARISLFRTGSTRVFRTLRQATKFVFRHFGKTYGLYLAVAVFSLALFLLYFAFDGSVLMHNPLTIGLVLLVQQAFIWLRIGTKVWLLGSELALHTQVQPLVEQPTTVLEKQPVSQPDDLTPTPLSTWEREALPSPE